MSLLMFISYRFFNIFATEYFFFYRIGILYNIQYKNEIHYTFILLGILNRFYLFQQFHIFNLNQT
jgi:hypothetical protein